MRVILLADRSFASREQAMLARLQVGLADEGCRVVRAVPGDDSAEASDALGPMIVYDDRPSIAPMTLRAGMLLQRAARFGLNPAGHDDRPVDIIHAFGDGSWRMARALAAASGATLAMEVWSRDAMAAAHRLDAAHRRDDQFPRERFVWMAPDNAAEAALKSSMPSANTRLAPWGVHVPGEVTAFSRANDSISAVIVGSGQRHSACQAAIGALARMLDTFPQLFVFVDDAFLHGHGATWKLIESSGLRQRLSVIENLEGRREPVVCADLLIQPESRGEHRTILLDAMAAGMAVVAREDPGVSALIDGQTAALVAQGAGASWETALRRVLSDLDGARQLGAQAREFIRAERLASAHLRAVLNAYVAGMALAASGA